MVSTSEYYSVCQDLIQEVIEIFDTPRFFHLGMDEETAQHQQTYNYAIMRQNDLWWDDLHFYVNETEKKEFVPGSGPITDGVTPNFSSKKCPNRYCKATGITAPDLI